MINVDIFLQSKDEKIIIPESSRNSIEIIGKTVAQCFFDKISGYRFRVVHERSDFSVRSDNIICLSTINLTPLELISPYKNKIYFFDDLDAWKISNIPKYATGLIFDHYIHPRRECVLELEHIIKKEIHYLPWSCSEFLTDPKSVTPSMFLDVWKQKRGESVDREYESLKRALCLFNRLKETSITIYVHIEFSNFFRASNVVYINDMPRIVFLKFLRSMWFYATAVKSSYEFIVVEASVNGSLVVDVQDSLVNEHKGGAHVISSQFFADNWECCVANYDSLKVSLAAKDKYTTKDYISVFSKVFV